MTVQLKLYRNFTAQQELELRLALERVGFSKQEVDWSVNAKLDPADPVVSRVLERRAGDLEWHMHYLGGVFDWELDRMREVQGQIDEKLLEVLAAAADARPKLSLEAIIRKVAEARAKLLNKLVNKSIAKARARAIQHMGAQIRLKAQMMGAREDRDYYNIFRIVS